MNRFLLRLAIAAVGVCALAGSTPAIVAADNGHGSPTLSFFSGGGGAHADWLATTDQPLGDTDNQAIRLQTTDTGYAGILVHHVTGIPATSFPDSSFWNKTPYPYTFEPYTQGSPRLVVEFQTPTGQYDGDGELDQNVRGNGWEQVSDDSDFPNSAWDDHYNCRYVLGQLVCDFKYHQKWQVVQADHAGDTVLDAYLVADNYNIYHLIDDINVDGKMFSSASDNGNGNNDPAGPDATTDPSLLPPLGLLFVP